MVKRFKFESYYEAKLTIEAYVGFYNNPHLHSGIDFKTPQQKWNEFDDKETTKFIPLGEAKSGSAGEQPAKNILSDWNGQGVSKAPNSRCSFQEYMPRKTHCPFRTKKSLLSDDV